MNKNEDDNSWHYFQPNVNTLYSIKVFDDGNIYYKTYKNEWVVYGTWMGKSALLNCENQAIKIESISNWKLERL